MTDSPLGRDRRLGEPLTQAGGSGEREIPGAGSPEARRTGPGAELSSVFADRLEWSEDLRFAEGEANVVGSAELALNRRGSFHFAGKLENQGFPGEYAVVRPGTAKELVPEVASALGCTGRVVEVVGHYEDAARREQGKLGRVGRPEGPGDRP